MTRLKHLVGFLLMTLAACTSPVSSKPTEFLLYADGKTLKVHGAYVTAAFFAEAGVKPLFGRLFAPQEYSANLPAVILSNAAWQGRFHSDPAKTFGNSLRLDGTNYAIVGVLPPSFETPDDAEFLIPKENLSR